MAMVGIGEEANSHSSEVLTQAGIGLPVRAISVGVVQLAEESELGHDGGLGLAAALKSRCASVTA
jgi:hypothetical protein